MYKNNLFNKITTLIVISVILLWTQGMPAQAGIINNRTQKPNSSTLFFDNFSGDLSKWSDLIGTWYIDQGELFGQGAGNDIDAWIYAGDAAWTDYVLKAKVTFLSENATFVLRSTGHWQNEYRVEFWQEGGSGQYRNTYVVLKYQDGVVSSLTGPTGHLQSPVPITDHCVVEVQVQANYLTLFVNDQYVDTIYDPNPLPNGRIGLGVIWNLTARFDDVLVTTLSPIDLQPREQKKYGEAGDKVTYTLKLQNQSGVTDSFDLNVLPGNTWSTSLSANQVGPIDDGKFITFTAQVDISPTARPGDKDTATIQATSVTSPTVMDTALLTTTVSSGKIAYVSLPDDNMLALVDVATHSVIGSVDLAAVGCLGYGGSYLSPDGRELYVTCEGSSNVVVLDTATNSLIATIPHPPVASVAFTKDGAYALINEMNQSQIDVVETATHTIIKSITTPGQMGWMSTHPYLNIAYAAGMGCVYVIDTLNFELSATIPFGSQITDVEPSPDGKWLFAADRWGAGIAVIDAYTNKIVTIIPDLGELNVLDITPDGSRLFAPGLSSGNVLVIDAQNFSYLTSIQAGGVPSMVETTCDGKELFIENGTNLVPVINTQTNTVIDQISVPGAEHWITICSQYFAKGVFLDPPEQNSFGKAGSSLTYPMQLHNFTGASDSFDLTLLPGNAWPSTLSITNTGIITDGGSISFTAKVEIPASVSPGDKDSVSIQATSVTSPTIMDTALLTTTATATSGKLAYVPMSSNNSLALIDTKTHATIDTIDMAQYGCNNPQRARLNLDGTELYVMCDNTHNIVVLKTTDLSLVATFDRPGACTQDVAFVQSGAFALASSNPCPPGSLPIDVIDTATHTIVQSIPTSGYAVTSIAAHPSLPLAYAAGLQYGVSGGVLVIDTNTFSVQTIIPYGGYVWDVQPSPDGQWLYASEYYGNGLAKIDVDTNTIVDTLPGYGKFGLDISPDGSIIYASEGWDGVVNVINAVTMDYLTTIGVGANTWETELSCDGSELYVAREAGSIPVIDTHAYSITYDIPIPGTSSGTGIAICPQYVAKGVFLDPSEQNSFGKAGSSLTYPMQLHNFTGASDSFDLTLLPGNAWPSTLSITNTGVITDGGSISFTVQVEIPASVSPGDKDSVSIQATSVTSPTIMDTALLTTTVSHGKLAYVTLPDNNELVLIDTTQHAISSTIDLKQYGCFAPQKVRITPDGTELYVLCSTSANIIILNIATQSLIATIGNQDWNNENDDVAFTQNGAFAMVSSTGQGRIDVVNTATHTIVQSIPIPGYVSNIAVHPYLHIAYAATGDYSNGSIFVIDTTTFTIKTNIHFGSRVMDVHLSPDGHWLFASDYNGYPGVAVIDTTNNTIVKSFPNLGSTYGLQIMPDGSRLFAGGMWSGVVHVIDAVNSSLITDTVVGGSTMVLALTCDGSELYVPNDTNKLSVIDTQNYKIVNQIPLPGKAIYGIAICPQYVAKEVFLDPPEQNKFGKASSTVAYPMELINRTGASDSFDLTLLPGNAWPSTLSITNTGVITDGGSISFTVQVEIPASASPGDKDSVSIQATSVTSPNVYNATAKISTSVSSGKIAYVTFSGNNQMALVDTILRKTIGTVDLGTYGCIDPSIAKLTPDGAKLYIPCPGSDTMLVFDTATNSYVTKIDHPAWAINVAFTQDGRFTLVGEKGQAQIDVIDNSTNTIIKSIATPKIPTGITVHPFLPIAYVATGECCLSNSVLVIDTTSFTLITSIPYEDILNDMAVSPDGRWLYVSKYNGWPGISVIDTNTNSVVTDIWVGGSWMPQITPDGSRLFAVGGWSNSVYVIDATTNSYLTSIGVGGNTWDLELSCDGRELYVADETDTIPVIDTQTNTIVDHIQMPIGNTYQIALCPQYVTIVKAINDSPTKLGDTTTFTATVSPGNIPTFSWNFDDGFFGEGNPITHTYGQTGTYHTVVTATSNLGSVVATTDVTIVDRVITGLVAHNDSQTELGKPTRLWATIADGTNVTYSWNFGDGSDIITTTTSVTFHTYEKSGSYTVTVKAKNSVNSETATTDVVIENMKLYLPIIIH